MGVLETVSHWSRPRGKTARNPGNRIRSRSAGRWLDWSVRGSGGEPANLFALKLAVRCTPAPSVCGSHHGDVERRATGDRKVLTVASHRPSERWRGRTRSRSKPRPAVPVGIRFPKRPITNAFRNLREGVPEPRQSGGELWGQMSFRASSAQPSGPRLATANTNSMRAGASGVCGQCFPA